MTAATDVRLQLSTTQAAFVEDRHRYGLFTGGVGSGKTFAGAVKALTQELGAPTLGLVAAPTYPMLRDVVWRTCLELWAPLVAAVHRSELRLTLRTGAEILFRSADDPDKLRGPNCAWAWLDEGAQCGPDVWRVLIGRLRQHGQAGRAWVTSTPAGFNWLYDVFVTGATDDTTLFRAATASNPFVDRAFVEALRSQYPSQFALQELGGEFVQLGGGLVKREWFQIVDAAPAGLAWCRFWDLATSTKTSADYTASIGAAFDADGTLYLQGGLRGKWEWPATRRLVLQQLALERGVRVGIEQAGFQLAAVQELLTDAATFDAAVQGITVDKDKLSRALPWIARAESGKVRLVRGAWCADFLDEVTAFPAGQHDDYVDATSGAVALAAAPHSISVWVI